MIQKIPIPVLTKLEFLKTWALFMLRTNFVDFLKFIIDSVVFYKIAIII
jgi:hypothetical protein